MFYYCALPPYKYIIMRTYCTPVYTYTHMCACRSLPSCRRTRRTELAGNFCCRTRPEAFASASGRCLLSFIAHLAHESGRQPHPHFSLEKTTLAGVGAKRKRRPLAQLVGHDVTVRIPSAATVTSGWAGPASRKGPALSYIPPSLGCCNRSVLSSLTVPVRTVRNSSWSIETCKKRTCSRFPVRPQPLTGRTALPPSEQTNIWLSTPGPQHRIPISSSAEQQPRGARVLFPPGTQTTREPWRAAAKTDQSLTFGGQRRHLHT